MTRRTYCDPDFAKTGYLGGVPMGGDLTAAAPPAKQIRLMVRARFAILMGANLDPGTDHQGLVGQ